MTRIKVCILSNEALSRIRVIRVIRGLFPFFFPLLVMRSGNAFPVYRVALNKICFRV
jgi:hypothetical protein